MQEKEYREVFQTEAVARLYHDKIYGRSTADESIWTVEQKQLEDVISRLVPRRSRYMDFACGTGRVIGFIGDQFESAQGVDISESMLEYAKTKSTKAEFICADITEDDSLIGDDYDLITAFRFFLNAQPSLRAKVIEILADKLSAEGILVFNIHNSKPSLLWLQNWIKACFTFTPKPTLSRSDVRDMVVEVNLEVIETHETCVMLKSV